MFNPIRKVKAAAITGSIASLFLMFGIDFDQDLQNLITKIIEALLPLIPAIASYVTKMRRSDLEKVIFKEG